ncbi:MAG: dUTP diphosphatase [Armatimonadetes bacterium]|nr:dUTP diphosphatase [Armatimonadota bacterium]
MLAKPVEIATSVNVEIRDPGAQLPRKANPSDACFDLFATREQTVPPGATGTLDLGFGMQLEEGWEAQIRGRSGLARRGIVVHPGTIDHLYRHNVGVLIHNLSGVEYVVQPGDRVAQMKIDRVWQVELRSGPVASTERGGFGSTGR